jgi:membrane protein
MRNGAEPGTEVLFLGGLGVAELARLVGREIQQDECLGRAAQLAYYFLFALFPFFLMLIILLGYLPIPNLLDRFMDMLAQMLPGDALSLVQDHVRELVTGARRAPLVRPAGGAVDLVQRSDRHHGRLEPRL